MYLPATTEGRLEYCGKRTIRGTEGCLRRVHISSLTEGHFYSHIYATAARRAISNYLVSAPLRRLRTFIEVSLIIRIRIQYYIHLPGAYAGFFKGPGNHPKITPGYVKMRK